MESLKKLIQDNDTVLWALTFVGVSVLVALGKVDAKVVEGMVMAIIGRTLSSKNAQPQAGTSDDVKKESK